MIPKGRYEILRYRDFYDYPRLILARNVEEPGLWIFDCAFSSEIDEYPAEYSVSGVPSASTRFDAILDEYLAAPAPGDPTKIALASISFDATRREWFEIQVN